MTSKWRALAPHFVLMFVLYFAGIVLVSLAFDIRSFWVSLAIALVIAIFYPGFTRAVGIEPEPWSRS